MIPDKYKPLSLLYAMKNGLHSENWKMTTDHQTRPANIYTLIEMVKNSA